MTKILFCLAVIISASLTCNLACAGDSIPPEIIQYKQWPNGRPNVMTLISGRWKKMLFGSYFSTFNGSWVDQNGANVDAMRLQICELIKRDRKIECNGRQESTRLSVTELYLGPKEGFRPGPISNPYQIGTETLASVPAGVEKVLHLRVIFLNQKHIPNEVISLAFDSKISDDDLRQIAYEEGVLRIPNFRED